MEIFQPEWGPIVLSAVESQGQSQALLCNVCRLISDNNRTWLIFIDTETLSAHLDSHQA